MSRIPWQVRLVAPSCAHASCPSRVGGIEVTSVATGRSKVRRLDGARRKASRRDGTQFQVDRTWRRRVDDERSDEELAVGLPAFPDHSAEDKRSQGWSRSVDVGDGTRRWVSSTVDPLKRGRRRRRRRRGRRAAAARARRRGRRQRRGGRHRVRLITGAAATYSCRRPDDSGRATGERPRPALRARPREHGDDVARRERQLRTEAAIALTCGKHANTTAVRRILVPADGSGDGAAPGRRLRRAARALRLLRRRLARARDRSRAVYEGGARRGAAA